MASHLSSGYHPIKACAIMQIRVKGMYCVKHQIINTKCLLFTLGSVKPETRLHKLDALFQVRKAPKSHFYQHLLTVLAGIWSDQFGYSSRELQIACHTRFVSPIP